VADTNQSDKEDSQIDSSHGRQNDFLRRILFHGVKGLLLFLSWRSHSTRCAIWMSMLLLRSCSISDFFTVHIRRVGRFAGCLQGERRLVREVSGESIETSLVLYLDSQNQTDWSTASSCLPLYSQIPISSLFPISHRASFRYRRSRGGTRISARGFPASHLGRAPEVVKGVIVLLRLFAG
jgi:hypothetical protein